MFMYFMFTFNIDNLDRENFADSKLLDLGILENKYYNIHNQPIKKTTLKIRSL